MSEEIFRKKILDKVKSPENLDDYIRVSNPGVWLLLISIIILLAGACVWSFFGHIDSTVETDVHAGGGTVICYIAEENIASVEVGMTVKFDEFEADIINVCQEKSSSYTCELQSSQQIPDGIYNGWIVTESIKPLSLVLN